jgi:hypothetical protein
MAHLLLKESERVLQEPALKEPVLKERVLTERVGIEAQFGVHVLLAVESGKCAWAVPRRTAITTCASYMSIRATGISRCSRGRDVM